ncbi:HNH endonuclease [Deinococcus radiopugnans]|uniref:HNH endonuclease n=1 Tax=Deinococcus radiopugnans TaxID=57497 RepID=UPI0021A81577
MKDGEIVHHRDGDSTNNDPGNLLVLPSQRYHAHTEYHLGCARKGMSSLFAELFQAVTEDGRGTLFERVIPPAGAGHCSPQTGQDGAGSCVLLQERPR